jgi:succinyl-CoA synthetase alpha subunit
MRLTEVQAKSILADLGVAVPRSEAATTTSEVEVAARRLGGPVAVKAQVRSGGRGKAGGVVIVGTAVEAAAAAESILGSTLGGEVVEAVLVEEAVDIAAERYLSVVADPSKGRPLLMRSGQGGVEIESMTELIESVPIDPLTREPRFHDPVEAAVVQAFFDLDALVVEINPLVETVDGSIIALDAKIELDDAAAFRHPELHQRFDPGPTGTEREQAAAELGLRLIELGGEVAILANGAGLTMATMDAVVAAGGRPANFLEIGGDAYTKATPALELVLSQPGVTSLLVNFCGAFARCDVMTAGVIDAWETLRPDLPVAFSIAGTGQDEARALLRERLGIESHPSMAAAVDAAVADTRGPRHHEPARLKSRTRAKPRAAVPTREATPEADSPLFVTRDHRVLVHGITGRQGTFWAARMSDYGTTIVGGVSPGKAGSVHLDVPVYGSAVEAAQAGAPPDVSVLFVPPAAARAATEDAITAGVKLIVVLTEFIPVADTMTVAALAGEAGATVVGPNTAGLVNPGQTFVGFMPAFDPRIFSPGRVGVVSRSGSLGTLAAVELTRAGLGQSAFIGVGGDPVSGTSTADAFAVLDAHRGTDAVVIIGEIGGRKEEDAATLVAGSTKPVVSFIAGAAAPPGKRMGHAGAIIDGSTGTHDSKRRALEEAGAVVVDVPAAIPGAVRTLLGSGQPRPGAGPGSEGSD